MAIRDGKSKFYRQLNLPKEVKQLLRIYNRKWKKDALSEVKGCSDGVFGKIHKVR